MADNKDKEKEEKDRKEKEEKERADKERAGGPEANQPIADHERLRKDREPRPTTLPAPGEPGRTDALRQLIADDLQLLTESQLDSVYQYAHSQVGR